MVFQIKLKILADLRNKSACRIVICKQHLAQLLEVPRSDGNEG